MLFTISSVSFLAGLLFALWQIVRITHKRLPYATSALPGPKGLPIIGSVHKLRSKNPWLSFHYWSLKYGPIYQVKLAGINHIWISDERIAQDLLSSRSVIYSDRPHIPGILEDNRTSRRYLPLLTRSDAWQRQRKFTKSIMNTTIQARFYEYPKLESKRLLKELLDKPADYNTSLESFVSRVTCRLAWGTSEANDELKQRARELLYSVSPTGSLANKFPFIMSLPACLVPVKAREARRTKTERAFFEKMQKQVKIELDHQKAGPSWTRTFFDIERSRTLCDDLEGAYAVGMNGIAGALTIAAPMQSWCLAMCHYPEVLPKMHEEIDRVCGEHPPVYEDMPNMPYLRACIRETLRWRPPVPTGIPHMVSQDDVYEGYHIPANSIIHPLEWSMSRKPEKFLLPEEYNPQRWLDPSSPTYQEPLTKYPTICQYSQFGFGRRICQGQEVAEVDLFVGIGAMAWGFDVGKKTHTRNSLGIPVADMDCSNLMIAKPDWADFDIRVRSNERKQLILQLWKYHDELGDFPPSKEYWDSKNPELGWSKV